jgi:hypothetical protein
MREAWMQGAMPVVDANLSFAVKSDGTMIKSGALVRGWVMCSFLHKYRHPSSCPYVNQSIGELSGVPNALGGSA